jgi:hypothetical protein
MHSQHTLYICMLHCDLFRCEKVLHLVSQEALNAEVRQLIDDSVCLAHRRKAKLVFLHGGVYAPVR